VAPRAIVLIYNGFLFEGGINMKIRGLELISEKQFNKDFKDYDIDYNSLELPIRGTNKSAGYDFIAPFDFILEPNEIIKIPTGVKVYMFDDECFALLDRSGVGFKYNVRLCNQIGIIDADYYNNLNNEGHIQILLYNFGKSTVHLEKGERVAQAIFSKYLTCENEQVILKKRTGGFGSTDKKQN